MEFRLSDETATDFTSYKNIRDLPKYKNNGWMVFRDWLVSENFTCTWRDQQWPTKNGGTTLGSQIMNSIYSIMSNNGCLAGAMNGTDNVDGSHTCKDVPCQHGGTPWVLHAKSLANFPGDVPWDMVSYYCGGDPNILLVRPL